MSVNQYGDLTKAKALGLFLPLAGGTMVDAAQVNYGGGTSYRIGTTTSISDIIVGGLGSSTNMLLSIGGITLQVTQGTSCTVSMNNQKFFLNGGQQIKYAIKNDDYIADATDYCLLFNISAPKTLTLPSFPDPGTTYIVKNSSLSGGGGALTVLSLDATVEAGASILLNVGQAVMLMYDDSSGNWEVLANR